MYVIGIDPGKGGAIVALNGKTKSSHIVDISVMPAGPQALVDHFVYLGYPGVANREECHIFIENVHSMPTDGVVSAFTFGRGLGWLEGVMVTMGLPEALKVNSKEWQKFFNMTKNEGEKKEEFKRRLKTKALELTTKEFKSKINLKTADALLIAMYGWKHITYNLNGGINANPNNSNGRDA